MKHLKIIVFTAVCVLTINGSSHASQEIDLTAAQGSGREIPRYIIRTVLGEVDYGLTSAFDIDENSVWVHLLPYSLAYFQNMSPSFEWPQGTRVDNEGRPSLRVAGLAGTGAFPLA